MEVGSAAVSILRDAELPTHGWTLALLADNLKIAADVAAWVESPTLSKRRAAALEKAAARLLKDAEQFALATSDELRIVRLMKSKAELAQMIRLPAGPKPRRWLGPCGENFLDVWRQLSSKPATLYEGSAALLFVTECCKLVDSAVTESAVLRAIWVFAGEDDVGARDRGYAAWSETAAGQKFWEVRELEALLRERSAAVGGERDF